MKNRSSKTILVFFALGLISCAFCVQQAQANSVYGVITFAGGVELNTATVNTATRVTGWLDGDMNMPTVESVSGNLDYYVNAGDTATFAHPWTFGSGVAALWQVDGFTFDLIASNIAFQGSGFLSAGVNQLRILRPASSSRSDHRCYHFRRGRNVGHRYCQYGT